MGPRENYYLDVSYAINSGDVKHDDREFLDQCQREVYEYARNICERQNLVSVLDLGCGSGYKLVKFFPATRYKTFGVELEPCYSFLCAKYPERQWMRPGTLPVKAEMIILADVIEHVVDPDEIMQLISLVDFRYVVLSTPERDTLAFVKAGVASKNGPPTNRSHVREWNFEEFRAYCAAWLKVEDHFVDGSQIVLGSPK